ncbi:MAG: type II secretion system protein GspE, partial [Desulfobacteraceae bacterium]|nr:type II secretion system protein GspE [Desulfobacteraceae bacterium]
MAHRLIGEILSETCGLSIEALGAALEIQDEKGGRIGEILIQQKAISETDLLKALSLQFEIPFSPTLAVEDLRTEFTEKVPIQFLKKYKMVPVINAKSASIAVNDPLLFQPLDDLRLLLGLNGVEIVLAPYSSIVSVINFAYNMSRDSAEQVIQDMHGEDTDLIISEIEEIGDLLEDTSDAPIIKLVN